MVNGKWTMRNGKSEKESNLRMKYVSGNVILTQNPNNEIAVKVLFFGAARDVVGQTEVANAFEQVLENFPKLRRFGRSLLFAVNQEYAAADREVKDGDELAVFPPVSGGSGVETETRRHEDAETRIAGGPQTGSPPAGWDG